uniref:DUF1758 domain-containing protein n=1 Tax=Haemonchus placei TaxID=6290 RepID=A0A0N4WXD3_HAEPC
MGEISVVNPTSKKLQKVQVLIDTGAEMSFIGGALAEELCLPIIEEKELCYYTFGSSEVQKKQSRRVKLPSWDSDGQLHMLDLLSSDIFTKNFALPPSLKVDEETLRSTDMTPVLKPHGQQVKPSILLGCDQAWQFLRRNCFPIQLPSGLYVWPTTLGNILAGQMKSSQHIFHLRLGNDYEGLAQWDKYWSFDPQINMIQEDDKPPGDDDESKWEKYWQLETAGIHEFGNSEKEEKDRQDKEVWDSFNRTVERRSDSYYVRLPWKDAHMLLSNNYSIAIRRLENIWCSMQKDQDLLQRYDAVFQEQILLNILEDVPRTDCATRGLKKGEFGAHQWWNGPSFLKEQECNWTKKEEKFQLESRDLKGGPKYLSRMTIEPNPTTERIENDMTATLNEIHNQATVATTVRSELFHILCSASLREMGSAKRVQLLNHFLLTVSLTKERLLRFGTRCFDGSSLRKSHSRRRRTGESKGGVVADDSQVQIKEVMANIEKDVRRLETTMKEIKEYMAAADRELKSNRQQLEAADILTKSIQALEDKVRMIPNQSSDDKIKILHERLTALEMT